MTISTCDKNIPCVDCDNVNCALQGKKVSDCPLYACVREEIAFLDCEHCAIVDRAIEEIRGANNEQRTTS